MTLPIKTPLIRPADYELSRVQGQVAQTLDSVLQFLHSAFTFSGGTPSINYTFVTPPTTKPTLNRSLIFSYLDGINGTTAARPAQIPPQIGGSTRILATPFAGSIAAMSITHSLLAGGLDPPSTGSLTLYVYKNNIATGAQVTLTTASGQATAVFSSGTFKFTTGDYLELWASSNALTENSAYTYYNYNVWAYL